MKNNQKDEYDKSLSYAKKYKKQLSKQIISNFNDIKQKPAKEKTQEISVYQESEKLNFFVNDIKKPKSVTNKQKRKESDLSKRKVQSLVQNNPSLLKDAEEYTKELDKKNRKLEASNHLNLSSSKENFTNYKKRREQMQKVEVENGFANAPDSDLKIKLNNYANIISEDGSVAKKKKKEKKKN